MTIETHGAACACVRLSIYFSCCNPDHHPWHRLLLHPRPPWRNDRLPSSTPSFRKDGTSASSSRSFPPVRLAFLLDYQHKDVADTGVSGILLTTAALIGAVREFKRGNSHNMNRYLRGRVIAQGATVAAMFIGSYVYETSVQEQKDHDKAVERERMMQILDSYPTPEPAAVVAPEPPFVAASTKPILRSRTEQEREAAPSSSETNGQPRKTRYIGENDQWKEYFNRKDGPARPASGSST